MLIILTFEYNSSGHYDLILYPSQVNIRNSITGQQKPR